MICLLLNPAESHEASMLKISYGREGGREGEVRERQTETETETEKE